MLMQDSGELKGELIPNTLLPYLGLSEATMLFLPFQVVVKICNF